MFPLRPSDVHMDVQFANGMWNTVMVELRLQGFMNFIVGIPQPVLRRTHEGSTSDLATAAGRASNSRDI